MKTSLKNWKTYLVASILILVAAGVSFIQHFIIIYNFPSVNPWNYVFMLCAFGFIFILIGFIGGAIIIGKYRHKTKQWNEKLPQDKKDQAWKFRTPLFLAALVTLILALVLEIITANNGGNLPF